MIPIPAPGLASIEHEEGCILRPYPDSGRPPVWTIGTGAIRDLAGNPVTRATPPITREQNELLLARDAGKCWLGVQRLFLGCQLTVNQWGALLSFTYNEGTGALQRSALRQAILAGRTPTEDEWTRYCLDGRPLRRDPILYGRRLRERALFGR